jgi:hypothetical protein
MEMKRLTLLMRQMSGRCLFIYFPTLIAVPSLSALSSISASTSPLFDQPALQISVMA